MLSIHNSLSFISTNIMKAISLFESKQKYYFSSDIDLKTLSSEGKLFFSYQEVNRSTYPEY